MNFHSPAADYSGREDVAHLLGLITSVLGELSVSCELHDGGQRVTFFSAAVEGHALDGVLDERAGADGSVTEATLFLRPYAGLRAAMKLMAERLFAEPLPSARR